VFETRFEYHETTGAVHADAEIWRHGNSISLARALKAQ
jgi:hypothetical protein